MLLLRPHHINCFFFYSGLGYSKKFVDGMSILLDFLNKNHNSKIKLIVKCDALCSNCPNRQSNNCCITEEKVKELDYNTLHAYKLKENEEYIFNQILNDIYKNFDNNKFHQICKNCNWYKEGICSENIIKDKIKKWNL